MKAGMEHGLIPSGILLDFQGSMWIDTQWSTDRVLSWICFHGYTFMDILPWICHALTTGALELYPLEQPSATSGQPAPIPTANHLPLWNSMAMFTVQPGRSYHAVQVVCTTICVLLSRAACFALIVGRLRRCLRTTTRGSVSVAGTMHPVRQPMPHRHRCSSCSGGLTLLSSTNPTMVWQHAGSFVSSRARMGRQGWMNNMKHSQNQQ